MSTDVALVTGASSGLGAAFARELAASGLDVVVVARRADRLEALRVELAAKGGGRCHVIVCDLSAPEAPRQIVDQIAALGLQVDWLVNNAGFATDGFFATLPLAKELEEVSIHISAPMQLTHLILPGMRARGRGTIINVGSVGSWVPTPGMATYSAAKAFVLSFSEALATELAPAGIKVLTLCPGAVKTEFHEVAGVTGIIPEFGFMTADAVARQAVAAARRGSRTLVPGWMNKTLIFSMRFMPRRMLAWIAGALFQPKRA